MRMGQGRDSSDPDLNDETSYAVVPNSRLDEKRECQYISEMIGEDNKLATLVNIALSSTNL